MPRFFIARPTLFPPWAGVARFSISIRQVFLLTCPVVDDLMRRRRNTNGVLRIQQFFAVPEDVFFCYGVQVVDADLRPYRHAVPQHPVRDRVIRASKVASAVPCNDFVPELPPLPRLVEVLVQPPVKPEGVLSYLAVQLQIVQPLLIGRQLAEFSIGFHTHLFPTTEC